MRKSFVESLCEEARKNEKIFLLTGDLGFQILEPFARQFPNRFINVGVAEANLITISAGLASEGFIPFAYSIATFATYRAFEQIRNDVALQKRNVKIVGIGAGLAYGKAGYSHHSIEDIALMNTIPNMTIVAPQDKKQIYDATKKIARHIGPVYMRIEANPEIELERKNKFEIGKGIIVKEERSELAILSTGNKLELAIGAANILKNKGKSSSVFSFPTIKPLDEKLLFSIFDKYSYVATVEEHNPNTGFGSIVGNMFLNRQGASKTKKIRKFGINNMTAYPTGSRNTLLKFFGLNANHISKEILSDLSQK